MVIDSNSCMSIEEVSPSPGKNGFLFAVPNQGEIDVPKRLRYETLDKIPLLNYKTKCRELTRTFCQWDIFLDNGCPFKGG